MNTNTMKIALILAALAKNMNTNTMKIAIMNTNMMKIANMNTNMMKIALILAAHMNTMTNTFGCP